MQYLKDKLFNMKSEGIATVWQKYSFIHNLSYNYTFKAIL